MRTSMKVALAAVAVACVSATAVTTSAQSTTILAWDNNLRNNLSGNSRVTQANLGGDTSNELKVSYQNYLSGTDRGTRTLVRNVAMSGTATDATLKYSVYFPSTFRWGSQSVNGKFYGVMGAKLLGMSGKNPLTGCRTDGSVNDWSVRVGWEPSSTTTVVPRLYYYPQDRTTDCGVKANTTASAFQQNRWYNIELRVKLGSTVGTDSATLKIDGVTVSSVSNVKLRGSTSNADSKIQNFMFNTLIGKNMNNKGSTLGSPYELYLDSIQVIRHAS